MTEIICTLIVCCAAVAMYWLYLNHKRLDDGGVDVKIGGHPYRAYEPGQWQAAQSPFASPEPGSAQPQASEASEASEAEPEGPAIPKLAQEYLDAAKKLDAEGAEQDMSGRIMIGDMRREAAQVCRAKAEELIKEAN